MSLKVNTICETASSICCLIDIYRHRSLACSCPWQEPDRQHRFLVLFQTITSRGSMSRNVPQTRQSNFLNRRRRFTLISSVNHNLTAAYKIVSNQVNQQRGAFGPPALLISDRPSRLWRCCAGDSISWGRSDAITSAAGRRRGRITPRHGTRERSKVGFEGEGSSEWRTPSVGTSRSLSPGKLRGRRPWRYGDSLLLYDYIHYDVDE